MPPFEMKVFSPSMRTWSGPSGVAAVASAATSEPASGSESANAAIVTPSPRQATSRRQVPSTSAWSISGPIASAAQARSSRAKRRWRSSKNGQSRKDASGTSIPLEHRLLLRREGAVGAGEVLGRHAQGLRHGLGLDRLLDRHRPLHGEHALRHGVAEGRTRGDLASERARLVLEALRSRKPAEEAPGGALIGRHEAAGVEELRRPALADDAGQDRAGAHVAAGESDLVEQERDLRPWRANADVGGHCDDGAGPGADAVDSGDDRLRRGPHRLDELAGHAREGGQPLRAHLDQRPDDLEHVAAGREIAAGAGDHHRLHRVVLLAGKEEVGELAVAREGERVLALRAVERDRRDLVLDREQEMRRPVARERQRDGIRGPAHGRAPLTAPPADALARARSRSSSSTSRRDRSRNISPIQRSCSFAMAPNSAQPRPVRLTTCARRSVSEVRRARWPVATRRSTSAVRLPFDTIMRLERSLRVSPSGALSSWAMRSKRGSVTSN